MLSRTSSDAARLRRSRSSSTVQPSPRNQYPVPDRVNPWVAQQQALLAATAAFERSHAGVSPTKVTRPSVPRTQSNVSRKSEGSHFKRGSSLRFSHDEGTSKGKARRNTLQYPVSRDPIPYLGYPATKVMTSSTPISRASPAPPSLRNELNGFAVTSPTRTMASATPRTGLRKARSMFCNSTQQNSLSDPYSMTLVESPLLPGVSDEVTALPEIPLTSTPAIPPEKVSDVRDQYFLEFHKGVRRSRSSLLLPLKKLSSITSRKPSHVEPVHHSARNREAMPTEAVPSVKTAEPTISKLQKPRSRSGGFREKIKKVFRRSSATITFPAQQIDASRRYFTSMPNGQSSTLTVDERSSKVSSKHSRPGTPPLPTDTSYITQVVRQASGGSQNSHRSATSASKSRVTSWTDSSAGDTIVSKDMKRLSVIHEVSRPNLAMPMPTRPASILNPKFLIDDPLETPTRESHNFSVEPKRVFSALMKEIARKDLEVVDVSRVDVDAKGNVTSSILDTLPSQQRLNSIGAQLSGAERMERMTIRTVTPDNMGSMRGEVRIPAVDLPDVTEESSDDGYVLQPPDAISMCSQSHRTSTSSGRLRRYRAHPPSLEQLAARADRVNQRWKTPLDDTYALPGDFANGVSSSEIPSRPRLDARPSDHDADNAIEVNPDAVTRASFIVSANSTLDLPRTPHADCVTPSIYSRQTATPESTSITPVGANSGTAVIITSRPVSSYQVGTPREGYQSVRSSRDWRAWLSKEVAELEQLAESKITIDDTWSAQQQSSSATVGEQSDSSSDEDCLRKDSRTSAENRPSSRMNDRFPIITSRRSSCQSTASKTAEPSVAPEVLTERWRNHSKENLRLYTSTPATQASMCIKPSSRPATALRCRSTLNLPLPDDEHISTPPRAPTSAKGILRSPVQTLKARSALELRNRYTGADETRRQLVKSAAVQDLEGDTIMRISEGPYARSHTSFSSSPTKGVENSPAQTILSRFSEVGLCDNRSRSSLPSQVSTPGHRLADVFLSERDALLSRCHSTAFI